MAFRLLLLFGLAKENSSTNKRVLTHFNENKRLRKGFSHAIFLLALPVLGSSQLSTNVRGLP